MYAMESSNFFERARNTDARGSTFNHVGGDQQIIVNNRYNGTDLAEMRNLSLLRNSSYPFQNLPWTSYFRHSIPDATYDSSHREHAPSCLPNTRTDILQAIMEQFEKEEGYHAICCAQRARWVRKVNNRADRLPSGVSRREGSPPVSSSVGEDHCVTIPADSFSQLHTSSSCFRSIDAKR